MALNFVLDLIVRRGVDLACHIGGAVWGYMFATACTRGGLWQRYKICTQGLAGMVIGHENVMLVMPSEMEKRGVVLVQMVIVAICAVSLWSLWMESRLPKLPPKPTQRRTTATRLGGGWGGLPRRPQEE